MGPQNENPDYLDLPDDEIMGMNPPAPPAAEAAPTNEGDPAPPASAAQESGESAAPAGQEGAATGSGEGDGAAPVGGASDPSADPLGQADDSASTLPGAEPAKPKDPAPAQPEAGNPAGEPAKAGDAVDPNAPASSGDQAAGKPAETGEESKPKDPTPEDFRAFYERILVNPIKANGKEIQLRSPEEAERLIQMGLNYTKKMQAWQPRMRVVTMLENNGLLDEAKLSHLIDLSKGDPLAIQKLLADSKFDPMSIDADKAASYKPGNHQVSDAELNFNSVLDEIESTNTGGELIREVAKQWDEQSRQAVYQDPNILRVINEQKANGLYARITSEMDHLRTLGHLQGVPFLQAYKAVGDMLHDQGRLVQKQPEPQKTVPQVPVETRVAAPAPVVKNGEKAAAASPTKATPAAVKNEQNLLDLPDDQFLEQMQGRL